MRAISVRNVVEGGDDVVPSQMRSGGTVWEREKWVKMTIIIEGRDVLSRLSIAAREVRKRLSVCKSL